MASKGTLLTNLSRSENMMYTFIVALILLALFAIWFMFDLMLLIRIPTTILLIASLYYQLMAIRYNVAGPMMHMKIEEKIMNEVYYQITKRNYEVTFVYRDDKLRIKSHNIPKFKAKWIKLISFLNVTLSPAWAYHDDIDEMEAMDDDDDDAHIILPLSQ